MQRLVQQNVISARLFTRYRRSIYAAPAVLLVMLITLFAMVSPADAASVNVGTYGAKGDGVSDDTAAIQAAINAAASGETVTFPEGTFRITSTLRPKSNITISGVPTKTVLTMPAQSSPTYMMYAENLSNLTLTGLNFRAPGYAGKVSGPYLPGAKNCRASNLYLEGLVNGLKLGSGKVATGWVMNDIVVRNTEMPMYISYVQDSTFTRVDLQAIRIPTTTLDHALYMERECRRLTFNDCRLTGGSGYSLHLYLEGGSSSDIAFNNLVVDGTAAGLHPVVISSGFSDIRFANTQIMGKPSGEIIRFYGGSNVVFDGFSASGGEMLVRVAGSVSKAVLRNGTYTGTKLGSGVTFENVTAKAAATTTTTAPKTTTTTAPKTTTTTAPKATTTTTPNTTASVAISSPANGSTVQGTVAVKVSVPSSTKKVRFHVDGRLLSQDYRNPWAFSWNTRLLTPGSRHALTAIALDSSGREVGRATVNVTIAGSSGSNMQVAVFSDLPAGAPYTEAAMTLAESGAVLGFSDNTFAPGDSVRRAQLAKMASVSLGLADANTTSTPFTDLGKADDNLYPHKYVSALVSVNATKGITPTSFAPWNTVTRAQLITIVVRSLQKLDTAALANKPVALSLVGNIGPEHTQNLAIAEANGLMAGLQKYGASWDPWKPATRGEVAQILFNVLRLT